MTTKKVWLPNRHTDRQTDSQTNRRWTKWSLSAAMLRRRHKNVCFTFILYMHAFWINTKIHYKINLGCLIILRPEHPILENQTCQNMWNLNQREAKKKKNQVKSLKRKCFLSFLNRMCSQEIFIYTRHPNTPTTPPLNWHFLPKQNQNPSIWNAHIWYFLQRNYLI